MSHTLTLASPAVHEGIVDRLCRLSPDAPPRWGRMSAHQMICHLADSYRVGLGEKQVSSATGLLQRTFIKWVALSTPLPWPKGTPTRPEVEQGIGGTAPLHFEDDRTTLIALIDRFTCQASSSRRPLHPIFGHLRKEEWLRWGYRHADHHLRQFGL